MRVFALDHECDVLAKSGFQIFLRKLPRLLKNPYPFMSV
jgi:hypothetical protein